MSLTSAALRAAVIAANAAGKELTVTLTAPDTTNVLVNATFNSGSYNIGDAWTPPDPHGFVAGSGSYTTSPISGTARLLSDGMLMLFSATLPNPTVDSGGRADKSLVNFPILVTTGSPTTKVANVTVPLASIISATTGSNAADPTVGTLPGPGGSRIPDPTWSLGNGLS